MLVLIAVAAGASAQSNADPTKAKARQLYDEGVTNYNLGHYEEALAEFESGYRLRQDPSFLFNIAQCQRNLNRYQDAERSYRAYLRESPDTPAESRERIQKLITEMDRAIEEQRAKQPPSGTQPATAPEPGAHVQQSAAASPTGPANVLTASSRKEKPVYKRGWFWGVMAGVVVVAVGVGVGVGLGLEKSNPFPPVRF